MSKVVLMTDSASDITVELEKEYGIKIICFQHIFGENTYTSRIDFDNQKYYRMLDEFEGIPSTSQVTPFAFQEIYEQELQDGCTDLIYVSINSKGSATHGNAVLARDLFYDEHPEAGEQRCSEMVPLWRKSCAISPTGVTTARFSLYPIR